MATYRMLALIPTQVTHPDTHQSLANQFEITRAVNAASKLPSLMAAYSNNQCQVDMTIKVVEPLLPSTVFSNREAPYADQYYISPSKIATETGDTNYYDLFVVFAAPSLGNAYTFSGLTTTAGVWIETAADMEEVAIHELGHWFTVYLGGLGYTNFPTCGGDPAMHCAEAYGFPNYTHPTWFSGFFQGTLSDGTGINATGWSLQTPTTAGSKTKPIVQRVLTRWGRMRLPRIQE